MDVEPGEAEPAAAGGVADHRPRVADRDPELVPAQAGGDVGMAVGGDVRVDAEGDARGGLPPPGRGRDPLQLAGRFRVDRLDPQFHRPVDLRGVFPTPVKTMSCGANPARRATSISPPELASTRPPAERTTSTTARLELAFIA